MIKLLLTIAFLSCLVTALQRGTYLRKQQKPTSFTVVRNRLTTTDKEITIRPLFSSNFTLSTFADAVGEKSFQIVSKLFRFESVDIADDLRPTYVEEIKGKSLKWSKSQSMLLLGSVAVSICSPLLLAVEVVEYLVPAMTAVAAAIGAKAEFDGKIAIANAREIASASVKAAAETEAIMCEAERVKQTLVFAFDVATIFAVVSLIAPKIADLFVGLGSEAELLTEVMIAKYSNLWSLFGVSCTSLAKNLVRCRYMLYHHWSAFCRHP